MALRTLSPAHACALGAGRALQSDAGARGRCFAHSICSLRCCYFLSSRDRFQHQLLLLRFQYQQEPTRWPGTGRGSWDAAGPCKAPALRGIPATGLVPDTASLTAPLGAPRTFLSLRARPPPCLCPQSPPGGEDPAPSAAPAPAPPAEPNCTARPVRPRYQNQRGAGWLRGWGTGTGFSLLGCAGSERAPRPLQAGSGGQGRGHGAFPL